MSVPNCTAPVQGHQPGSDEWKRCPAHGAKGRAAATGLPTAAMKPTAAAGRPVSIHRAASGEFDPTDYELMSVFDMKAERRPFLQATERYDWAEDVPHGNQCSHCGKHLRYVAVLRHTSGDHITVGEQCLGGRFSQSKDAFQQTRARGLRHVEATIGELSRIDDPEARRIETEARGFEDFANKVEERAGSRAALFVDHPAMAAITYPELFESESTAGGLAHDFMLRLDEQGSLTGPQIQYFSDKYRQELEQIQREEQWAAEEAAAVAMGFAAPRGDAIEVTGFVSKVYSVNNDYDPRGGSIRKMHVSLPGGATVVGTLPASLSAAKVGMQVQFTANFSGPKHEDKPMLAYSKSPRRAKIIGGAADDEE